MTAEAADPHIGLVVEGRGDRAAVPLLLRNYLALAGEYRDILGQPVTCNGRGKAIRQSGLEGFVFAAASRPGCRALVIVLDSDEDPACQLGPALLERVKLTVAQPSIVVLAEPNY